MLPCAIYILDGLRLSEGQDVRAHSHYVAILFVHVYHGLSVTVEIGMAHSPEIGQGCQERAIISVEAMVVMKVYHSYKGHSGEDVEPSFHSCWDPGLPSCKGRGGSKHGEG